MKRGAFVFTPPRKYLDLIRRGYSGSDKFVRIGKRLSVREFDDGRGYDVDYDSSLAMRLTQVLVQQGYSAEQITQEHMKRSNVGFCWIRRQADPWATSAILIDACDRHRKPMLATKVRHERILDLLRTDEVFSQKQLIGYVGTARDSDTQDDLRELQRMGVITITVEPHGKVGWKRISLSVSASEFRDVSYSIRRTLAGRIRRNKAMAQGFKRTSGGRQESMPTQIDEANKPHESLQDYLCDPMPPPTDSQQFQDLVNAVGKTPLKPDNAKEHYVRGPLWPSLADNELDDSARMTFAQMLAEC